MAREQIYVAIPEEWKIRKKQGLCPVCGNPREEFDKHRRVYCSEKCALEYSSHFITWSGLREEILERDGKICKTCNITEDKWQKRYKDKFKKEIAGLNEKYKDLLEAQKFELLAKAEKNYLERIKRIEAMDVDDYDVKRKLQDAYGVKVPDLSDYGWFPGFEVDHIIAICNGGSMWDKENLQTLCKECHKGKTKQDRRKQKEDREKKRLEKKMEGQEKLI